MTENLGPLARIRDHFLGPQKQDGWPVSLFRRGMVDLVDSRDLDGIKSSSLTGFWTTASPTSWAMWPAMGLQAGKPGDANRLAIPSSIHPSMGPSMHMDGHPVQ